MKKVERGDFREHLLKWLQLIIIVLMSGSLILVLVVIPTGTHERSAYTILIIGLIALVSIAFVFNRFGRYYIAAACTVAAAVIGVWGSLLLDPVVGVSDFVPLVYVTISVMLSSLLLPMVITIVLAAVQYAALVVLLMHVLGSTVINWPSFLAYVLIVSSLSIVVSYVSKHQMKLLQESSIRDHLTGLFNRRYFDETLEHKLLRGIHKNYSIGLILVDIDNFKSYNDRFGHAAGDLVLQEIANFLFDRIHMADIVCRFGGDEFAIILPGTTRKVIQELAEQLRLDVKTLMIRFNGKEIGPCSISQGLAVSPEHGTSRDILLASADAALYRAKQAGKDRVVI